MSRGRKTKGKTANYVNGPYSRILIPNEDGSFSAEILEFPGCFAEGSTREEALENLEKAADAWIDSAVRQRQEMPEPFSVRGFSGAISLRLPRGLHRQAARLAERESTSLNQYIVTAIAARVGADDLVRRMADRVAAQVVVNVNNPSVVFALTPSHEQMITLGDLRTTIVRNVEQLELAGSNNG